jgi:3-methyladenine DNA glycosylase/8-oxoguanine DNA glycosylase
MAVLDPLANDTVVSPSVDSSVDVGASLAWYRHGAGDPTTWLDRVGRGSNAAGRFVRATWTPDGPGTLRVRWSPHSPLDADAWGPGAGWLLQRVPEFVGDQDQGAPDLELDAHPVVARCMQADRRRRFGASSGLFHELLPTIIEQRITAGEALSQWRRLCFALSDPAPGPFTRLLLPPSPAVLRRQPSWWFHPLGIERKRAQPLIEIARHADKMWSWAELEPIEAGRLLRLVPGIGVWTIGCVLGPALGDQDAVPVGDYHVKNIIAWNLAGEPRATDERMLELLEPYAGRRGRVVAAVLAHGDGAPKFGPKKRIVPMHRW